MDNNAERACKALQDCVHRIAAQSFVNASRSTQSNASNAQIEHLTAEAVDRSGYKPRVRPSMKLTGRQASSLRPLLWQPEWPRNYRRSSSPSKGIALVVSSLSAPNLVKCQPNAGAAEKARSPKYLLEMARTFSLEQNSEPVLCAGFFAPVDLLVSADAWHPSSSTAQSLQRRLDEVHDAMERSQDMLRPHQNWYSAVLSFGLVRWWPIWMRARVARSLGPFKMVIECKATGVHF